MPQNFSEVVQKELLELQTVYPDYGYYDLVDELTANMINNPHIYKPAQIPLLSKDELK